MAVETVRRIAGLVGGARHGRRVTMVGLALVVAGAAAACGGPAGPTPTPPGYVSRTMLGDEWPLTVDEGVLRCDGSSVIIRVGGTDYAVGPLIDRGLALC